LPQNGRSRYYVRMSDAGHLAPSTNTSRPAAWQVNTYTLYDITKPISRQRLVHDDNLPDQSQPRRLSTHHPSTEQHQDNNVYSSRGTLRSLPLSLSQTLTRPLRRLWFSKPRNHRKSSLCWIQVPDTYHRTEIDTSTNIGWQYQDAEPLEPFSISELAASQARVVWMALYGMHATYTLRELLP
jgi:hypothetical protein